ncbi:MAG: bile acid:sodium symporter family protein [Planctomycetaceae bacterium]|nr:bile acid:sodium symporter family protein [Planctomycetales bacterium]MCB9925134.1 bile acid:sodium symporter family protein [Planctomycetaceae bacterium]
MSFAVVEYHLSITLLVTATLGMGATLTVREFVGVLRAPYGVLAVLLGQVVVSPLLALALAWLFRLPAGVAFGLLLIAAMPGGLYSNLLTYLGRGNVALSITATAVSTILCVISTSLVLRIYGSTHLPDDFAMPVSQIFFDILRYLLAPLLIGMTIRRAARQYAPWISRVFIHASTVLLALYIVGALGSGRIALASYGWRTPVALILFGTILMWSGVGTSTIFRLPRDDRFAIAIEVLVRNSGLALLIKAAILPSVAGVADPFGDGALYVILFYTGVSLLIGLHETTLKRLQWGVLYAPRKATNN